MRTSSQPIVISGPVYLRNQRKQAVRVQLLVTGDGLEAVQDEPVVPSDAAQRVRRQMPARVETSDGRLPGRVVLGQLRGRLLDEQRRRHEVREVSGDAARVETRYVL